MPYIKKEDRNRVDKVFSDYADNFPKTCGELNYCICLMINQYIAEKGEKYQTYNDIIGVLECAKQEIYRQLIAPYEDKKIKENGDVF